MKRRGLLKTKLNEGSLVQEGKKVRQSSPLFFLYSFGVLRPRRPFIRELEKSLQGPDMHLCWKEGRVGGARDRMIISPSPCSGFRRKGAGRIMPLTMDCIVELCLITKQRRDTGDSTREDPR